MIPKTCEMRGCNKDVERLVYFPFFEMYKFVCGSCDFDCYEYIELIRITKQQKRKLKEQIKRLEKEHKKNRRTKWSVF